MITAARVPDRTTSAAGLLARAGLHLSISLDTSGTIGYPDLVTAKDLRRILRSFCCVESRRRGSHLHVECGQCVTTVPVHAGEDIGPGLLRRIERDLEPCLGKGWLKKP
jgi:predicted RNA binding protein YcfA (HicA-like mRNA interferase family)